MKNLILGLLAILISGQVLLANTPPDEGMWLPMLVKRLNAEDMQKKGLKLTAEELYSINNSSLKDAIVSMGFFCTGEIVSSQGLYLTNHHCGYEAIQAHSSVNHDYLTDGFWALKMEDELPVEDLTVYTLAYMDDVTTKILDGVTDNMKEEERSKIIRKAISKMKEEKSENGKYHVDVKGFFDGNEYYIFVYNQYSDVRLVGAPPSAIGKFGGDTDNWMWPRHTGDFSMFRIYTAPDGSNAKYSTDNVPLKPKHHLPVSIKGVQNGDFAMIWGFPGTTDRYLTSWGIKEALDISNPTTVAIRDLKLEVMKNHMDMSPEIRIKYAAKYAQTANYWKYFIGQTKGLKRNKVYEKKQDLEARFTQWINSDPELKSKYGEALGLIEKSYEQNKAFAKPMTYINEAVFQGPEFIYYGFGLYSLYMTLQSQAAEKKDKSKFDASVKQAKDAALEGIPGYFKDYDMLTDKDLFIALIGMYYKNLEKEQTAYLMDAKGNKTYLIDILNKKYKGDINLLADAIFSKSILTDSTRLKAFLKNPTLKTLEKDLGFQYTIAMINSIRELYSQMGEIDEMQSRGMRLFVDGVRKMEADKKFAPNANSTLRMTYGEVKDYFPGDAMHYDLRTTLDGVMEKEDPANEEFIVPAKLKELYNAKDYGQYADKDGKMPVCFLSTNDITGGNSGSPVINGEGQLIGIAFDGNWEAMSGDIFYEKDLQRTINVDIRYVLFIVEKLGGAKNLISEMTIIK